MASTPARLLHPFPYLFLSCFLLLLLFSCTVATHGGARGFNVGVVLDQGSLVGKISLTCINMSVSDFYRAHPNATTKLVLHTRDSKGDVVDAAFAAIDLLKNERVQAIVGPQTSHEAMFLADLGTKSRVPVFSFSATSPSVSRLQNPYFVRAVPNDAAQAKPIAAVVQAFGWKRVVLVYDDTTYGAGPVPFLVDAFKEVGVRVPYRCVIRSTASDDEIQEQLYRLMTMQTRVFLVHMSWSLGSRLFSLAKPAGMMSKGYAWIITDGRAGLLDSVDPSAVFDSMQGVIGVKPFMPGTAGLRDFKRRWRRQFLLENPDSDPAEPNTDGLRAYDTVWALALAAESAGPASPRFAVRSTADSESDLATIGVSEAGPALLEAILSTRFEGLTGTFHLVDGELHAPGYKVVNVIGETQLEVGYWTPFGGLWRHLDWSKKNYTTSKEDMGRIIWPGEPDGVPTGWENPTGEKKMRIGIPEESGFDPIMKVEYHPLTNETIVSGYVIEVFEAALKELPYSIPFEYVPFRGDYNSLIYQIYLQNFDAVVGDVTITANRSQYVDFTLPYTERGVAMVVPVKDQTGKNGWIFLKPLVLELWLAAGAFFVFTGVVVWVLEHRVNNEFRGAPHLQVGGLFYFSFSTLVFAHKEKVVSNLSRVVVIVWLFVVLILTSSYTASLASMFTVRKLQPKVTDIGELKRNGEYVGYPKGSFVRGALKKWQLQDFQLRPYTTPQEFEAALNKGSRNGGVSAVVNEIPYHRVFLKEYCSKYIMTGLTYNTDGLGFAFPKGSPLVNDLSRAILTLTQGNKISEIQQRWFGDQNACLDQRDNDPSSNILDFKSFWGLFFITGIASTTSLLISIASFFYNHWHALRQEMSGKSVWQKLVAIFKYFDRKVVTHKKSSPGSSPCNVPASNEGQSTLCTNNGCDSPLSLSNHTHFDEGTPSREFGQSPQG